MTSASGQTKNMSEKIKIQTVHVQNVNIGI